MGTFWHALKPNKTTRFPRNWCFLDTETYEVQHDEDTKTHALKLGVACYVRDSVGLSPQIVEYLDFVTTGTLWDWLLGHAELDRRLVILGYNVAYDFRIGSGFKELTSRGYVPKNLFMGQYCTILTFQRSKHKVVVLDMLNYVKGTLESWGELLGIRKVEVDFGTVTDERLLEHCRRDVDILKALWGQWREFVQVNDLGCFAPTLASQSMNAFRHRLAEQSIVIHADPEATSLERDGYFGGRCECFHVGKVPGGPWHKLDVNSMYPFCASNVEAPRKLLRVVSGATVPQLARAMKWAAAVAQVRVRTEHNCYPIHTDGGLTFPVGDFWTTLAGPELSLALAYGDLVEVGHVALYERAVLFDKYVDTLLGLRHKWRDQGNPVFVEMCKRMSNSLYGKLGQLNETWKYEGYDEKMENGVYRVCEQGTHTMRTQYVICGHSWIQVDDREAPHSFPAISAYVCSAARVYLWHLMTVAGLSHVFYCDTDSLIVDAAGYRKLRGYLDSDRLGALKCEYRTKALHLYAPKDYETDHEQHHKGVPASAEFVDTGLVKYWEWEGMKGAIASGRLDCVQLTRQYKFLGRKYLKGQVSDSGSVSPLVLAAS